MRSAPPPRRAGASVARSAGALLAIPCALSAQITVAPTTQVSLPLDHAAHTEAFVSAHPREPGVLAACSMLIDSGRSRLSSALYLTRDAGSTWRLAVHDTISRHGQAWDPTCGFAPGRTVLLATLPTQGDPFEPGFDPVTRVHRSTDGGVSWARPAETVHLDNEDVVADWTGGPFHGRVYLVGVRLSDSVPGRRHLSLAYSADGGRTFHGPVNGFPPRGMRQGTVGAPVVAGDGSLLVPVFVSRDAATSPAPGDEQIPEQAVAVVPIRGGGSEIGAPIVVAPFTSCGDAGPPVAAVDRTGGPFAGRAYVALPDASQGRCQIELSWSDDGEEWSTPLPVDDPPIPLEPDTGPDAFLPQVAVNHQGVVGIAWYDRREDPANRDFRLRFTASADGGRSVMRSVPVSGHAYRFSGPEEPEALFPLGIRFGPDSTGAQWLNLHTGRSTRLYYGVGDYGGLAARADGRFQTLWIDNRTTVPQLFTAAVAVSPAARTPEERDAALGRLVSDSVLAAVSGTSFDAESCAVGISVELMNGTQRDVALPLTVRVDDALSQLGVPVAVAGGVDELGRPIWTVGSPGRLGPGGRVSHTASFELEYCRRPAGRGALSYRSSVDARLQHRLSGTRILALKLRVFEAVGMDPG